MDCYSIGKNIRKYRLEKKMSQEKLAELTFLTPNYIGMLERGDKMPSMQTFINIVNALEVSADMILCEVLENGYEVKNSILNERMAKLTPNERARVYAVIDAMISK